MVRTHSAPRFPGIDPSRVLAFSAAIALHVLALALLLAPLSYHPAAAPPERIQVRWQLPELVPTPPPPPRQVQPEQPRTAPAPRTQPVALDIPSVQPTMDAPVPDVAAMEADAAPIAETTAPTALAPPVPGIQLQYLAAPPPPYPRVALQDRLTGTVMLRVLVDVDGKPLQVTIESSSGHRVLDQAARTQVLRQWRFKPAIQDGQAIQAYGLVPIAFSLD
ncbi:energy transducer TonB [[Pseudomonas] boreopolis]|uniref:energy transducer TonB n=1 Tax=Xanthomonas boreopolis TaxID=86183 RepID=UPI003D9FE0E2